MIVSFAHRRGIISRRLFLAFLVLTSFHGFCQDNLNVISGKGNNAWLYYTDARNALYHHLTDEAFALLEKRKEEVSTLESSDDWKSYQAKIRRNLDQAVGPFPAKTPLNARVVRTISKPGYRIEHIIYESQPGYNVTSSLFIPEGLKRRDKAPAVIYCSGHTPLGYRSETYQQTILNLVRKGFIVFAFDPIGQGERLQYFNAEKNRSSVGGSTAEHSYPGSQAFITGSSQARYMIWDGIRAVDYLMTRREVDAGRIGITGRSGGGTQSAYIAAFDERIHAVAPECYITSFARLLESIGPQDAEQNFPGGIARGLDHGDLLMVRAPKPALMITTTGDFFSIQGARETAAEVRRVYKAYNAPDNFGMCEDDAGHASTKNNREALYAFFQKHLRHPGSSADEEVEVLTPEELRVTPTGQLATSLGSETVFSLNRVQSDQAAQALAAARKDAGHITRVKEAAATRSGYRKPTAIGQPVFTGRVIRDGYTIEKYFVKGEGDYVIPYLRTVPEEPNGAVVVYLHPAGKATEAQPGGEIEAMTRRGFEIIAADLPGVGELGNGDFHGDAHLDGISHNLWYSALLIDRSIAGLQAGDISRLVSVAGKRGGDVFGVARGSLAPALLYAAVLDDRIRGVGLDEPLISYHSFVTSRKYHSPFVMGAVAGQLDTYDQADLAAALAPRHLMIVRPASGDGTHDKSAEAQKELDFIESVYRAKGAGDRLFIYQTPGSFAEHLRQVW